MIVVGKLGKSYGEAKKLYRTMQDFNRKNPEKLVNSPFIDIENVTNVLEECPERLASSLQYFLQGIGLLSAMPMRKSSLCESMCKKVLGTPLRNMSIDEAGGDDNSSEASGSGAVGDGNGAGDRRYSESQSSENSVSMRP
jgi:hypothetical protein